MSHHLITLSSIIFVLRSHPSSFFNQCYHRKNAKCPRNADRCVVTEENDDKSVVFSICLMHAKILFLEIENIHIATDYCNIKTISFKLILY